MSWEVISEEACQLGECPIWDATHHQISWVDIEEGIIYQYQFKENKFHKIYTGQKVGAICSSRTGDLIAALQNGFARINRLNNEVELIVDPEAHLPGNRFNDGKCDPAGRFWAGTMSYLESEMRGCLYALEKDLSVTIKIKDVGCSNGLAWDEKRSIFYFIDTATGQVAAYDYEPSDGSIKKKRIVIGFENEQVLPDGMTIDSEGMLWIALWGGGRVERWDPHTRRLLDQIYLPVSQVTSCTFGGERLNDLFITSARIGLSREALQEQPLAGHLFVVKNSGYDGMPATEFAGFG